MYINSSEDGGTFIIKVILIHGFHKKSNDMRPLAKNLASWGYRCYLPDFPLTFKEFTHSVSLLCELFDDPQVFNLGENERIHLVGHSTGGLVIRTLLSHTKYAAKIGKCVLIATPNQGSSLAEMAGRIKLFVHIYKTLRSLTGAYIKGLNLTNPCQIEVAAIAGNKNNLLLGKLLKNENDGRVEVPSVYYPELNDFIILPYGHKEIHHQRETARLIDAFLRKGRFHIPKGKFSGLEESDFSSPYN
jgi:pimeloyl-ACP methyl ester carboxylesterase